MAFASDVTTSSVFLDSLLIDDSLITCEVCFEPFNHQTRPPKLLPCGHNFCESCIFSLCLHQEYYLLDYIKCPTCRREFTMKTARQAPTNYDLCKILENLWKRKEHNVTVIEVPDKPLDLPPPMKDVCVSRKMSSEHHHQKNQNPRHHHVSKKMKALAKKSEESKHLRCSDCQRKISQKNLFRVSRYCVDCTSTSRMTIVCLECCVNYHNGHELLTEDSLHHNQLRTLTDLRKLRTKILDTSEEFDNRCEEIRSSGMEICGSLMAEKQTLLTYTLASIDDVIRRIESAPILFPPVLRTIKDEQSHNFGMLEKLGVQLEKSLISRKNTKPTSLTFIENMNESDLGCPVESSKAVRGAGPSLNRSLSIRQSRVSLRGDRDDSLFHESIASLVRLMHQHPMCLQLDFHHSTVSPKDTVEQRKQKIMSCAHAATCMLEMDTQVSMLPIFADVLLNCFYQLNRLSKNKFVGDDKKAFRRVDIWKQVQTSYTELFGITAKHFPSHHPERVDILDDLAYLCHLYSDVADQGTVTICLIEAARARASDPTGLSNIEQQRTKERLELIDEHLTECRRLQKLLELRKTSKTKRRGGLKRLFGGCFMPQERVNESLVY